MLKFCSRCCLDGTVEELVLDKNGVCNFCHEAQKALEEIKLEKGNYANRIARIKSDGEGKRYDALIGLSGGVDSSTALHLAVNLGLRVLAFNVDTQYNDPRADENILKMVEKLKVPFIRYPINKLEFLELQGAYLQAGVINVEAATDHILAAVSYELANRYNCRWILSGGNVASESIMPLSWSYPARDLTNLKSIYKWATGKKIKYLPLLSLWKLNYYWWIKKIKVFYPLDYV